MKLGLRLKGRRWTSEEDIRLKSLIEADTSTHLIAAKLKRTTQGVKSRAPCVNFGWEGSFWGRPLVGSLWPALDCRDRGRERAHPHAEFPRNATNPAPLGARRDDRRHLARVAILTEGPKATVFTGSAKRWDSAPASFNGFLIRTLGKNWNHALERCRRAKPKAGLTRA